MTLHNAMAAVQRYDYHTADGRPALCERCGLRHPRPWKHEGQCTKVMTDGDFCQEDAILYRGKPGNWCPAHSEERRQERQAAALALSGELAALMPREEAPFHLDDEEADFVAWSITQGRYFWPMVFTPDGHAVHEGEGCLGEQKRGTCHHQRDFEGQA